MITTWRESEAGVTFPEGFVTSGVRCGLKTKGEDIALIVCDTNASVAGVFTTNRVQAACVRYSKRAVRSGQARAVFVNAGNANACNGEQGDVDNLAIADRISRALNTPADSVLTASTGVIGHLLPMSKIVAGIAEAVESLERGVESDAAATRAIMTTDTFPKMRAVEADADSWVGPIRLGGMCKGSGMIAPNMATMLAFITTDVRIPSLLLQQALQKAVEVSFNRVTVDGDTSTNDMCLVLASGVGEGEISRPGQAFDDFVEALSRFATHLAKEIARDGEGATKLVQIDVNNALTTNAADKIARTIAESPLVKTALFGCDPNWGRILAAAGRAGVPFDPDITSVSIGPHCVFKDGAGVDFDRDAASETLKETEVVISLNLNMGEESATFWTCDYSYDYIRINAEYHT